MSSGSTATARRLFHATFLFGLACGVSLALTPLLLSKAFDEQSLGFLAVANAFGIFAMAWPAGFLARKTSPTFALVSFLAAYAIFDGGLPFVHGTLAISLVRFCDGACSVGVWVSSETLLLGETHDGDKANLTSQYAIWLASGYVGGSVIARAMSSLPRSDAYLVSAAIAVFAALYVAISVRSTAAATVHAPIVPDEQDPPLPILKLLARIRCSCFATFVYGYFEAAVVLFLPLYLSRFKHIEEARTTLIPGIFCFGMLLASNPVGRVADRRGHLSIMRLCAAIGLTFVFGFVVLDDYRVMYVAIFLAGATLASMSPVSLALQGVVTPPRDYARGNSLYNLWYASGILLGPPISGAIYSRYGGGAMLGHLAALWAAFVIFSLVYAADDPAYGRRRALHSV